MEWYVILGSVFFLLLALFLMGLPIFLSFLLINVGGLYILTGDIKGVLLVVNSMFSTSTSISLAAIPLFVLLGELLFRSGSVKIIFDAVDALVGNFRARLYAVSIVLSTVFGALSGSAMAVAAMMGSSLLPEMQKREYDRSLSMGTILAGASLAPIIPPSVMAVVLGILSKVSISALLVAGILPGILLATAFLLYTMVRGFLNPNVAPLAESAERPWSERGRTALRAAPFLLIIVTILGLILGGIATPTEAAAVSVFYALVLGLFVYKEMKLSDLPDLFRGAAVTSGAVMLIISAAALFSWSWST